VSILPDYNVVIFDEAHTVEAVASDHLGINVTSGQIEYVLNKLYNDRTNKGLLVYHKLLKEQQQVDRCRHLAGELFDDLWQWRTQNRQSDRAGFKRDRRFSGTATSYQSSTDDSGWKPLRVVDPGVVANRLSPELQALAHQVKAAGKKLREESEQQDFLAAHDRLMVLADELETWRTQTQKGTVYWMESHHSRRQSPVSRPRITLAAAPIDIGPAMRDGLFNKVPTVVMTSATLSIGRQGDFEFFKSRVGLTQSLPQNRLPKRGQAHFAPQTPQNEPVPDGSGISYKCDSIQVGSPFDYREQAELVTLRDMPDPTSSELGSYEKKCIEAIEYYAGRTDGHTFVLFTSYDMLRRVAAGLQRWLASRNLRLLSQADGTPRTQLLEQLRRTRGPCCVARTASGRASMCPATRCKR
jgi:ATP-dependent DNA helicase DinG